MPKTHRATVTEADLHSVESVTVDLQLLDADLVILIAYTQMEDAEARNYLPTVVHVDEQNRILNLGNGPAEAIQEGTQHSPHARTAAGEQTIPVKALLNL